MSDPFLVRDEAFRSIVGRSPKLSKIAHTDAHEGPVYVAALDALFVTSARRPSRPATIMRIDLDGSQAVAADRVHRLATGAVMPNGMTLDADGRLIVCEQGDLAHHACISRIDPVSLERVVLVDHWRGHLLNSPNDVAAGPDGALWFSDPSYGHLQGFRPPPEVGDRVYRWDRSTGRAEVAADEFDKPNGVALSPDGATLYVTDSGADQADGRFDTRRPHHVVAFDVRADGQLGTRRVFAVTSPGIPDGLKTDAEGNVYVSSTSGVLVFTHDGEPLGKIAVPGTVNFTFGGTDGNVLFVTADSAVWAAELATTGHQPINAGATR